jgi:hypothetical protein
MAEVLTKTGGEAWLSKVAFVESGMGRLSVTALAIFVVVFFVRFCFTSITSCPTAITPAIIGFLVSLHNPDLPIVGIALAVTLIAQCLSIIPVTSAPAWLGADGQHSVSRPRSSNWTFRFPASSLYGAFFVKEASRHFCRPLSFHSFVRPAPQAFFRPDRVFTSPSRAAAVKDGASSAPPKACP